MSSFNPETVYKSTSLLQQMVYSPDPNTKIIIVRGTINHSTKNLIARLPPIRRKNRAPYNKGPSQKQPYGSLATFYLIGFSDPSRIEPK